MSHFQTVPAAPPSGAMFVAKNDPLFAVLHAQQAAYVRDAASAQAELTRTSQMSVAPKIDPNASWWNIHDAMTMCAVILTFGVVVVLVAAYLIRKENDSLLVLKVLATILILTFSVFLIVAGYNDQQIAPAIGLLGTVAGYLLGRDSKPTSTP